MPKPPAGGGRNVQHRAAHSSTESGRAAGHPSAGRSSSSSAQLQSGNQERPAALGRTEEDGIGSGRARRLTARLLNVLARRGRQRPSIGSSRLINNAAQRNVQPGQAVFTAVCPGGCRHGRSGDQGEVPPVPAPDEPYQFRVYREFYGSRETFLCQLAIRQPDRLRLLDGQVLICDALTRWEKATSTGPVSPH
jgi:hypothetical protein